MHYRARSGSFGVSVGIGVEYMGSCRFNGTISNFTLAITQLKIPVHKKIIVL
jgi:hypothetical protein